MARHHGDAARFEVSFDGGVEQPDRGGIERGLRLVEQPDRTRRGEEAGERELPLLPGRQETGGKIGEGGQPKRRKRAGDCLLYTSPSPRD